MAAMEGEGRAPKPTGPQQPKSGSGAPPASGPASPVRSSFVSVDLEDVETVPHSVEEIGDDIDIEFDDGGSPGSVEKLLAMTGENWSIEDQRESLKEAAKDKPTTEQETRAEAKANAKPSLSIPTPYDFGAADLVTEVPGASGMGASGPAAASGFAASPGNGAPAAAGR